MSKIGKTLTIIILSIIHFTEVYAQETRNFIEAEPEIILSLDDNDIFNPTLMAMGENGNICIYDYGVHQLFFYNIFDQVLKAYGEGLGGGPKEFRNPTSLYFNRYNSQFWLTDPEQARISFWKSDGELTGSLAFPDASSTATKALPLSEIYFVWQPKNYRENGFELAISSVDMQIEKTIGAINVAPLEAKFLRDGNIAADNSNIYYAGYNSDFIKKFSQNGTLENQFNSIEKLAKPKVFKEELDVGGLENVSIMKLSDDTKIATLDIEVYENKIFVLFSGNKFGIAKKIDVYDKSNGDYIQTYKIKYQNLKKIEIYDGKIFAISNKEGKYNIVKFNL